MAKVFGVHEIELRFPAPGELSAAAQQYFDQRSESEQAVAAKLDTFVTPVGESYTDYVVIAG